MAGSALSFSLAALMIVIGGCSSSSQPARSSCGSPLSLESGAHHVGLQSCAGMVGMDAAEVTLEVHTGSNVALSGVGYGYADPESTNSSVLTLVDWKPGTTRQSGRATFKAVGVGVAAITLRAGVGCLDLRQASHCSVAYVHVRS